MTPTARLSPQPTTAAEQTRLLQVIWTACLAAVVRCAPIPFLVVGQGLDGAAALLLYLHRPTAWPLRALARPGGAPP